MNSNIPEQFQNDPDAPFNQEEIIEVEERTDEDDE